MPINKQHQRARYAPVVSQEETYKVEAGTSAGMKFEHTIQYGRDFDFQLNHNKAKEEFHTITSGRQLPPFRGSVFCGNFSKRNMFTPTWARVLRDGEVVYSWTKP